ncbi:putative Phosphoribosylformylglycinamidine synthase protein, partial [Naja naja]
MVVLHYYQRPSEADSGLNNLLQSAQTILGNGTQAVQKELCFNVNWTGKTLPSAQEMGMLQWVFGCPFEEGDIAPKSFLSPRPSDLLVEIGPRLNFSTAYSTNAVSVCLAAGLENIDRVECSRRYLFKETLLVASLYDRMTEQTYPEPIQSFAVATHPEAVFYVDILGEGRPALMKANNQL